MTAAVIAAVRHKHTEYDELLAHGMDRTTARQEVADEIPRDSGSLADGEGARGNGIELHTDRY